MIFFLNKKKKPEEQKNVEEPAKTHVQESNQMHIEEEIPLKNEEEMEEEELLKRAKELSLQEPTNIVQEKQEAPAQSFIN